MKQTNNAIKFLMAQYRAIFKHAYLKGIASAVVMTAGLAAGASNAVAAADISDLTGFATPGDATLSSVISGSGDNLEWNANVTVTGTTAGLTASGDAISFTGSGNLTVGMDSGTSTFTLTPDSGNISIDIASVTVNKGTFNIGESGSTNTTTVIADAFSISGADSTVSVGSSGSIGETGSAVGTLSITDGKLLAVAASGSGAKVFADNLIISGGSIETSGSASGEITLTLGNGSITGEASTITVQSGDILNLNFDSDDKFDQTLDVQAGTITLAGTMNVSSGNVVLGSNAKLNGSGSSGTLTVKDAGELSLSFAQAKDFMSGSGRLIVSGSTSNKATLFLSDSSAIDLSSLNLTNTAAASKIVLSGNSVLGAKEFNLDSAVTIASGSVIESDILNVTKTATNGKYTSGSGAFSVDDKLTFASGVSLFAEDVNLGQASVLELKEQVDNLTDNADKEALLLSHEGSISGEDKVNFDSGAALNVVNGSWTNSLNMTLGKSGSSIHVGSGVADATTAASLTFAQGTDLEIAKSGSITVGSGSGTLLSATLDISKADLSVSSTDSGEGAAIVASKSGTLILTGQQINTLTASTSKVETYTASGGTINVIDDLTIAEDEIVGAAASGALAIVSGNLVVDGDLTISAASTVSGSLSLGTSGSITATNLILNNIKSGTSTLAAGEFTVTNGLKAQSTANTISVTGATLNLGEANQTSAGSISSALQLSGAGSIDVLGGTWTANKVTLAQGKMSVKDKSSLNVSELKVTSGSLTVEQNATTTLTKVDTSASTADDINVSGSLTINGNFTAGKDGNPDDYGVNIGTETIHVSETGTLNIGKDASQAISVTYGSDGSGAVTVASGTFSDGAFDVSGGKVSFAFDDSYTFNAETLGLLKEQLFGGDISGGVINVGSANISGITEQIKDNTIAWDALDDYQDILEDYSQNELSQAVVTGIESSDQVKGNFGALSSDTITNGEIQLQGNTSLSAAANNGGNFATGAQGVVLGLSVAANDTLRLENGGKAGTIKLASGSEVKVSDGATTLAAIDGGEDSKVTLANAATTVNGKAKAATFTTNAGSDLVVTGDLETLAGSDASTFEGAVKVSGNATFKSEAELSGNDNVFAKDLTANEFLGVYGDTQVSGTATFDKGAEVADGATLTAATLVLQSDTVLSIGSDGDEETSGSAGYLDVGTLALNGGTLVIDPDYTQASSVAAIDKLSGSSTHDTSKGGVLSGSIAVAQNSGLMLGDGASRASMLEFMQQLPGFDGALDQNKIGSVAYLTSQITIANGGKLIIDSTNTQDGILSGSQIDPAYLNKIGNVDLYLGKNSALAVDDAVLDEVGGAIYFDNSNASIKGESGSKVILVGDAFLNQDSIILFQDAGNDGVMVAGENNIRVETLNGLMFFTLEAGKNTSAQTLQFDVVKAKSAFLGASTPVRNTLLSYASKTVNYQDYGTDKVITVVGDKADQSWFTISEDKKSFTVASGIDVDAKDYVLQDGVVYERAYNSFLQKVTRNSNSGIEADQAARLAAFGGAMQAALSAGATTYDAISGRMGIGAQTGSITFADNGQGAGLWVTPVYKNHDSDGFEAQGLGYGVDMDLYGLALGADYSLGNGLRVGAAFNVGSGDADGQGAGSVVSNDFDYYGFAVYGGYTLGALSLVGDVSYTVVDNDLEANTAADKLTTSTDTSILSVGVTGQYTLNFTSVDITPHAGLRYSYLDMDDYAVKGSDGVVGNYTADSMSVFSIPVGVTFAKDIVSGDWTIKPALDLTLTANMGDDTTDGTMSWSGVSNLNTAVQTEVLDNFTYGATLGVSAKSGNMSFGFGVNYTGSSSADEYGVGANARFVF